MNNALLGHPMFTDGQRVQRLTSLIGEMEALKQEPAWGAKYKSWSHRTEKALEEDFGQHALFLFKQQQSVNVSAKGFAYELQERKTLLEDIITHREQYQPGDVAIGGVTSMSGLVIEAVGDITNSGTIKANNGQFVALRSQGKVDHSGEVSFANGKDPKQSFFERITNNATAAVVLGGLLLLIIVYVIFIKSGINLAQFK